MKKPLFYNSKEAENFYNTKEKLRIWKIGNSKKFEKKSKAFNKKISQQIIFKKQILQKIGNATVYAVDGEAIRNKIDDDFTMGGHGYRYLYIPIDEIWIEKSLARSERQFVIWHEYLERRLMQKGMTYDVHDIASSFEIILRRGDAIALPIMAYRQGAPYSCGPAALKIVLEFWGTSLSEKELMRRAKTTSKNGTDPKNLVLAAKALGYKVIWKQNWTADKVKKIILGGQLVICNFQFAPKYGEGHYAVIIGFTKSGEFILADPAFDEGFRKIKINKFMKQWYELEDDTRREGIVIFK